MKYMSSSSLEILRRSLCWLAVILEVLLGLLTLVLLSASEVYSHVPFEVIAALVLGLAPIVTACLATRNPRRASRVSLCLTPFAVLFHNRLQVHSPLQLIVALATTLLPGVFWTIAARRNWPLPLSSELCPRRPLLTMAAVAGLMCVLLVTSIAVSLMLPWWSPIGDCSGGPLLDENGKPRFVDFTAKIVFVGPKSLYGYALFSIAHVDERFSDSIWVVPNLLILRDFFHSTDRGEFFFVEGKRSSGPFTRFLPVVERVECGHSSHVSAATVVLRTLGEGPPQTGVRIIGDVYTSFFKNPKALPGVEVLIKGPAGNTVAVTDNLGVYDVAGLPFGPYTVELSTQSSHPVCALNLEKRAVDGCRLFLDEVRRQASQRD